MTPAGPKEIAFDEQIAPLLEEIKEVCKKRGIAFFANFLLDLDPASRCYLMANTSLYAIDPSDPETFRVGALHDRLERAIGTMFTRQEIEEPAPEDNN